MSTDLELRKWVRHVGEDTYHIVIAGNRYTIGMLQHCKFGHWYALNGPYPRESLPYDLGTDLEAAQKQLLRDAYAEAQRVVNELRLYVDVDDSDKAISTVIASLDALQADGHIGSGAASLFRQLLGRDRPATAAMREQLAAKPAAKAPRAAKVHPPMRVKRDDVRKHPQLNANVKITNVGRDGVVQWVTVKGCRAGSAAKADVETWALVLK